MARKPRKPAFDSHADDDSGGEDPSPLSSVPEETPAKRNFFEEQDDRLRRAADGQRRSRAEETSDENHRGSGLASSPQERRRSFRDEWTQEALPKLPKIPGWHLCWLSTTNTWDPIHRRIRMGYVAVKPDELPGFEHLAQKSAEWGSIVGINEMILFKIPQDLFQQIMTEFHHEQPLDEESAIRAKAEEFAEGMEDSKGNQLVELEPDMAKLGRRPRRNPTFS